MRVYEDKKVCYSLREGKGWSEERPGMRVCVEDDDQEGWDRSYTSIRSKALWLRSTHLQSRAHNDLSHLPRSYWWCIMLHDTSERLCEIVEEDSRLPHLAEKSRFPVAFSRNSIDACSRDTESTYTSVAILHHRHLQQHLITTITIHLLCQNVLPKEFLRRNRPQRPNISGW
jgi:hypothetical protein